MPTFWGIYSFLHLVAWILTVVHPENDGIKFTLSTTLHSVTDFTSTVFTSWCLPSTHLVIFIYWTVILYIPILGDDVHLSDIHLVVFVHNLCYIVRLSDLNLVMVVDYNLHYVVFLYRIFISLCLFVMCYIVHLSDFNLVIVVDYNLHYIVLIYRTFISYRFFIIYITFFYLSDVNLLMFVDKLYYIVFIYRTFFS